MKRLIYLAGILALVFVVSAPFASCKKDKAEIASQQLAAAVEKIQLPKELNSSTTLTECYYSDKTLTFRCEVDKKAFQKIEADKAKNKTLGQLSTGLFPRNLVNHVIDADASIRYIFVNDNDSVTFLFTADELANPN